MTEYGAWIPAAIKRWKSNERACWAAATFLLLVAAVMYIRFDSKWGALPSLLAATIEIALIRNSRANQRDLTALKDLADRGEWP